MKRTHRLQFISFFIILISFVFSSCDDNGKIVEVAPSFYKYINSYTYGTISRGSDISVQFVGAAIDHPDVNQTLEISPFTFDPPIEGVAVWSSTRTVKFLPNKILPSGKTYLATFDLRVVLENLSDTVGDFQFNFRTKKQAFSSILLHFQKKVKF